MIRLLSTVTLILVLVLFPPTVLALVSNNAVPGDVTYPIKRSLEDIIFAVASLNPVSKAWFAATRSDRRFKEFSTLIANGKGVSDTLTELVSQTDIAANEITKLQDPQRKKQLLDQLSVSIKKYDQGLEQASKQVTTQPTTIQSPSAEPTPFATTVTPQPKTSATPTTPFPTTASKPSTTTRSSPASSPTLTPLPKTKQAPSIPPQATPQPTEKLTPILTSYPTPQPARQPNESQNIEDARKKIGDIEKRVEEEREKLKMEKKEFEEQKNEKREKETKNSQQEKHSK